MTIEQLKRHMDRRFDRLERTKANRSDLRRFVTRREFAARLKTVATKEDLKRFATKDDLKRYATKEDLNDFRRQMVTLINRVRADIERALSMILSHHSTVLDVHERRITDLERQVSR